MENKLELNINKGTLNLIVKKELFTSKELVVLADEKMEGGSVHVTFEDKNVICLYQNDSLGLTKTSVPFFTVSKDKDHSLKIMWDASAKTMDVFVDQFEIHVHKKMG